MSVNARSTSCFPEPELNFRDYQAEVKSEVRHFLFPHTGGTASIFHSYINALTKKWHVIVIQYLGREWRFSLPLKISLHAYANDIVISFSAKLFVLKVVKDGHFCFQEESPHLFKNTLASMLEMRNVTNH